MNSIEIRKAIIQGELDGDLARIADAISKRRQLLTSMKHAEMEVGMVVRFNDKTRPKYLVGEEATITKVNPKKVVVRINDPMAAGRFKGLITVPPSLVDIVEEVA